MIHCRAPRAAFISAILVGLFSVGLIFPAVLIGQKGNDVDTSYPRRAADAPILVSSNADWASVPGISGDGSDVTPYLIKDKVIDAIGVGSCIWIGNTTAHFIIRNCSVKGSAAAPCAGIRLSNLTNGKVEENNCTLNAGAGILVEGNSSFVEIDHNHANQNGYGIMGFQYGHDITVGRNNASFNTLSGGISFVTGFSNVTIINNNASNNVAGAGIGINVANLCSNFSVVDNYVGYNGLRGIRLYGCNYSLVQNNTLRNNPRGIFLETGDVYCRVIGNNITGGTEGIYLGACNLTVFENNTINGNSQGFYWVNGNNNTISANNVTGNTNEGIFFNPGGHNNTFFNNNFTSNNYGIRWASSGANGCNNTIAFNYFAGNTLECIDTEIGGDSNWFYGNNFSDAPNVADLGRWNHWDNGSVGNYWSVYAGVDLDDNFVGDTPYVVPTQGGQDNFPMWDDGDDVAPSVLISGLISYQLYGFAAPSYSLSLSDAYGIDDIWISYDLGNNNQSCGASGLLPNWGGVGNGTIVMSFYANDTGNNVGQASITILKDIEAPVFTSTGLTSYQLIGNSTPSFVLAISESNPTNEWWYSYDGGANNIISGQSGSLVGWDTFPNGTVTIRFFTNDTMSNVGWIDVVLWRDCAPPSITSTGLTSGASFTNAPTFALVISEANRDKVWYSVDGGATNYTLSSLTGSIDSGLWAGLPLGNIIVTIWSNDTLGNTASIQVTISKTTGGSTCEGCTDSITWVIIGVITAGVAVGLGVIIKKRKSRTIYPDEISPK